MHKPLLHAVAVLVLGLLYWELVCWISGVSEPWDAPGYWSVAYPISLVLSAGAGWLFRGGGWPAGAVLTFAQLPATLINNGPGPLLPVGLLFLCGLAIPASAIAAVAARLSNRRKAD